MQAYTPESANNNPTNVNGTVPDEVSVAQQSFTNMTLSESVAHKSFKTLRQAKGISFPPTTGSGFASPAGASVASASVAASVAASPARKAVKIFELFHFDFKVPVFQDAWEDETTAKRLSVFGQCLSGVTEIPHDVPAPGEYLNLYHRYNIDFVHPHLINDEIVKHQPAKEQDKFSCILKLHSRNISRTKSLKKMQDLGMNQPVYTQKITLPFKCCAHVVSKQHDPLYYGKRFFRDTRTGAVYFYIELIEAGNEDLCDPRFQMIDFAGRPVREHLQPIHEEDNSTLGGTFPPVPMTIGGSQSGVASTSRRSRSGVASKGGQSQSGRARSGASTTSRQSHPAYYCNADGVASMDVDQYSYYTNDEYSYNGQHVTTSRDDPHSRKHRSSSQSQSSRSRSQSHVHHGARSSHDNHSHRSSSQSQGSQARARSQSHADHVSRSSHDDRSRKSTVSDRKPASKHALDVADVNTASRHESPPKKGRSDRQPVQPSGDDLVSPMKSYASPINGETPMFFRQTEGIQISPVQLSRTNEHPLQGTTPRTSPRNHRRRPSPTKNIRQSKKNMKRPPPGSQPSVDGSHDNPISLEHILKSPDGKGSKED